MTDLEIDKALALSIGWRYADIMEYKYKPVLEVWWVEGCHAGWRIFSHLDWATIGPIAERYNMFPYKLRGIECHGGWNVLSSGKDFTDISPQRAIALAVIGGST